MPRRLNVLLIISSLFGYLEWGGNNTSFLAETEWEILRKSVTDPMSVIHPFILLPLAGQLLLIFTVFQNRINSRLTYLGIACISVLFVLMFVIGILSASIMIVVSTLPFLILAVITVRYHRRMISRRSQR